MHCPKCNNFIPDSVPSCPVCKANLFATLSFQKKPSHDKYGYPVREFRPEGNKYDKREIYLHRLPQFDDNSKNNNFEEIKLKFPLYVTNLLFGIFTFFFTMYNLTDFYTDNKNYFPTMLIVVIFWIALAFIFKRRMKMKQIQQESYTVFPTGTTIDEHKSKEVYYSSDKVIGYSTVSHTAQINGSKINYYEYYEFDKENISHITYNTEYAEYEFYLKEPAYVDYDMPPQKYFRIADIFDDTVLSIAIGSDLPAKNINF